MSRAAAKQARSRRRKPQPRAQPTGLALVLGTSVNPNRVTLDGAAPSGLWVDYGQGPTEARLGVPLSREQLSGLQREPRSLVLVLSSEGPIVIGVLQPLDAVEASSVPTRLELSAQDEVVLSCGEASLTLRRNGRAVLRGTHVETHSSGVNRIKGGTVSIN